MTAAIAVGILACGGAFLILRPGLVRTTFGFVLLGHAANVLLLAAGGPDRRNPPLTGAGDRSEMADPLPQAFVLTAIVISFGITVHLLALARAEHLAEDRAEDSGPAGDTPEVPR
ncbi:MULTISPECIES: sodium:proton antiporter [Streptomyces]|uniref:Cation:proton antiporter n=2 Tax=Streptomyces TaxID=1883 RepID=A0A3R7I9C8_9ACTN|nr:MULTISPECIES: sodium:proton antiporter [Streptomyces]KNE79096.1 hypothetical protein ADZ36_29420 [Streptomyces fradiae]OFA36571.1 cation:proton antiporter [Streptomyces fradiae]PQM22376.1 cation:proton antiporter [Streptomyces xinghaiensis]RKM96657.1 cation:proton antiporter [Streptomyces xinghaiensis]RNC74191.1 cation:proton antiporter [Streptomyces xinghaiensis]